MLLAKERDIPPRRPVVLVGWPSGGHWTMAVITSGKPAAGADPCPDNLTDCFGFRFTIGEYVQTALCLRSRINCGAILCHYVRFHGRAALGSRKDQISC